MKKVVCCYSETTAGDLSDFGSGADSFARLLPESELKTLKILQPLCALGDIESPKLLHPQL